MEILCSLCKIAPAGALPLAGGEEGHKMIFSRVDGAIEFELEAVSIRQKEINACPLFQ